jgi:hypothetical protein
METPKAAGRIDGRTRLLRIGALLTGALWLAAPAAHAACDPDTCDADLECGLQACDLGACKSFFAACDAAEFCDGAADDCPPDRPRELAFQITGADLCEAVVSAPGIGPLAMGDPEEPAAAVSVSLFYTSPTAMIPNGTSTTFHFDVTDGAASGDLFFVAGPQDGYVEIVAPDDGATVGAIPNFLITPACPNCDLVRMAIFDDFGQLAFETPGSFDPNVNVSTLVGLFAFEDVPNEGLAPGGYSLMAEGIRGSLVPDAHFIGDASGRQFAYRLGSGAVTEITFAVPEPAEDSSVLAALAPLAACAARGDRRRRR